MNITAMASWKRTCALIFEKSYSSSEVHSVEYSRVQTPPTREKVWSCIFQAVSGDLGLKKSDFEKRA